MYNVLVGSFLCKQTAPFRTVIMRTCILAAADEPPTQPVPAGMTTRRRGPYSPTGDKTTKQRVTTMKHILIVEDDENLSRGIAFAFEQDGYAVATAATITAGRACFERQAVDIVLLDVGLPDGSGLELCKSMRAMSSVPVIMLTVCDLEIDEVSGLMAGADDYITKPFSLSILRARVEAVLRRLEVKEPGDLRSGGYRLDTNALKLFRDNAEIPVSATEFRLLKYLMSNAGQILTKEQILAVLWDNQGNFVDENTLSVNISRVRAKLGDDPKNPGIIKTVHGMGYVWVKE